MQSSLSDDPDWRSAIDLAAALRRRETSAAETLEGQAGQIVIVPPETPHKFANVGEGHLRQVDIHASKRFITDWLE